MDIYCLKISSICGVAFLCSPSSRAASSFQTSLSTFSLPFSLSWRCNPSVFSKYVNGKNDNRLPNLILTCNVALYSGCPALERSQCRQGKQCQALQGLSIPSPQGWASWVKPGRNGNSRVAVLGAKWPGRSFGRRRGSYCKGRDDHGVDLKW